MVIFNTTFHVENTVVESFLIFMKKEYIPACIAGGFMHTPSFSYIYPQHEQSGSSYSLQFKVKNMETLEYWLSNDGENLQKSIPAKFGNDVTGFMTVMEQIEL